MTRRPATALTSRNTFRNSQKVSPWNLPVSRRKRNLPSRKSVGYFAAVRLRDGKFLYRRETGRFNGETFWEFLKTFREASAEPDRRILAISDNAQYHRSRLHLTCREQQPPHLSLRFLPPYTP